LSHVDAQSLILLVPPSFSE